MSKSSNIAAPTDAEGYLFNPDDWNVDIAKKLAEQEDIILNEDHWMVINYIRRWHGEHGVTPSSRDAIAFMKSAGKSRNFLFELFPYGYVQQACKIAGMKKPRAWSTG